MPHVRRATSHVFIISAVALIATALGYWTACAEPGAYAPSRDADIAAVFNAGWSIASSFKEAGRLRAREAAGRAVPVKGPGYSDVVREIEPAVVSIKAAKSGSGVIVLPSGYIVTSNHVVETVDVLNGQSEEHATKPKRGPIKVTLSNGKQYKAVLVGADPISDLAVVKIEAGGLPYAQWGDMKDVDVGDDVIAVGSPFEFQRTVTFGHISAKDRKDIACSGFKNYIQTDAALNRGNSGGGLFHALNGKLIGINTCIPNVPSRGIAFAIGADIAQPVVKALIAGQRVAYGRLGVVLQPLTEDIAEALALDSQQPAYGALVSYVHEDSPAAMAEIRPGDVIVRLDDSDIRTENDLRFAVMSKPPNTRVRITLMRNKRELTVYATLDELSLQDRALVPLDLTACNGLVAIPADVA